MREPVPFGKYLLLDRISVGGMAEVFKAKSYGVEGFEKIIAIKRILPSMGEDRDFIKMFIDEAKIAGQLNHANICQIFELGRIQGAHFIAMEYIWGKDLLQVQNRFRKLGRAMPVTMASYVIAKVCEGLDYAHKKKDAMGRPLDIVHRDCSPQNVLVSYEGEVKLIDFGIARASSRTARTNVGVLKGKFGYMSPEQVRGLPLDRRSDIFALGTILYESLTGSRLFQGESDFSTLEKVRNVDVVPPSHINRNIPSEIEAVVMRSLQRDPDERYESCAEMLADLQAYLTSQPTIFTAKHLGDWLKRAFAEELSRERELIEEYKRVGRDGLIAGKPQAQALLDVRQELGEPGAPEGDPTELGGPTFDDLLEAGAGAVGALRSTSTSGEFEHEAGIEAYLDSDEELTRERFHPQAGGTPAAGTSGMAVAIAAGDRAKVVVEGRAPGAGSSAPKAVGSGPVLSLRVPGERGAVHESASGSLVEPQLKVHAPRPVVNTTEPVSPLPTPAELRSPLVTQPIRRRSSFVKDVTIGVSLAGTVFLAYFVGKQFLFGGAAAPAASPEARTGTLVVHLVRDTESADVYIDGKLAGRVEGGAAAFDDQPLGRHRVAVLRPGLSPCEQSASLDEYNKVAVVRCIFEPRHALLFLDGLDLTDEVFVDEQQISREAAREAIKLQPGVKYAIRVQRGGRILEEFALVLEPGEEVHRRMDGAGDRPGQPERTRHRLPASQAPAAPRAAPVPERPVAAAAAPQSSPQEVPAGGTLGYFTADTTPWARVLIDGRDTGITTPIAASGKISLRPGTYTVTFVVGKQRFDYPLRILPGKHHRLVKELPVQ